MSRGLPQDVRDNLEKCRSAAVAAVDAYNRPGPRFRTAQYVVLIVMAWAALFHAIFYRRGRRPWYRRPGGGKGVRYIKIDGDPKHWDLAECLKQHYGDKNPAQRKNLEFIIGLRNKIEHRHLPELDATLYGECQAALLNLEELLVEEFGARWALADQLAVSLQFSRAVPDEKKQAAKLFASTAARSVKDYIEKFRGGLSSDVLDSVRYSYTVFLVPKVGNRASAADAAVTFVKVDEASEEELKRLQGLNVLIREKHIPIVNLDNYKPGEVVVELAKRGVKAATIHVHTQAWKYYGVRPPAGDVHPERTQAEYCIYDQTHEDYVYTKAWIEKLARELPVPETYTKVLQYSASKGS